MRIGRIIILALLVAVMSFGLYSLNQKKNYWQDEAQKLSDSSAAIQKENQNLQARLNYFKEPQNLLKELKSQFNYRQVGEKLIIVVPGAGATSSTVP